MPSVTKAPAHTFRFPSGSAALAEESAKKAHAASQAAHKATEAARAASAVAQDAVQEAKDSPTPKNAARAAQASQKAQDAQHAAMKANGSAVGAHMSAAVEAKRIGNRVQSAEHNKIADQHGELANEAVHAKAAAKKDKEEMAQKAPSAADWPTENKPAKPSAKPKPAGSGQHCNQYGCTDKRDDMTTSIDDMLLLMPLAKHRFAAAHLSIFDTHAELVLKNLETPIVWRLDFVRLVKADVRTLVKTFHPDGSRFMRAFKDVPAIPSAAIAPNTTLPQGGHSGAAEFGLQTDDQKEYFLSKFGDLVGIVTVKRNANGGWSAGLAKSNLPRVLSRDSVKNGIMPPDGYSALPKSLEAVVPHEYQYWKARGDEARQIRDAFVDSEFFNEECIKAVDGELRKVEVRYFLYETQQPTTTKRVAKTKHPSLGALLHTSLPLTNFESASSPMGDADADWLETLDKEDKPGHLSILSPTDRNTSPREMARAAKTLKGDFILEHDDTRVARAAFASAGVVFKIRGAPERLFCASFPVHGGAIAKQSDGHVAKVINVQGIRIEIDRPKGFVQTGKDATGASWERTYQCDYGFIANTNGGDGGSVDVFVGPDVSATAAFIVTQKHADGTFDEHKIFIGFTSERDALETYKAHIPTRFFDGIVEVPMTALKSLLNLDPKSVAKKLEAHVRKIDGVSYEQVRSAVNTALTKAYPTEDGGACCPSSAYCDDIYDDRAIFYMMGKTYQVGYTYADGVATLSGDPQEVQRVVTYKPLASSVQASAKVDAALAEATKTLKMIATREIRIALTKDSAKEEQYVLGVVLEPDVVDAQNDTYSEAEVRIACERFMEMHRTMGLMHKQKVNHKVQILENYIAPTDFEIGDQVIKRGTWLMGVRVKDAELWKAVKAGVLTGFSIGGSAIRKPLDEVAAPSRAPAQEAASAEFA